MACFLNVLVSWNNREKQKTQKWLNILGGSRRLSGCLTMLSFPPKAKAGSTTANCKHTAHYPGTESTLPTHFGKIRLLLERCQFAQAKLAQVTTAELKLALLAAVTVRSESPDGGSCCKFHLFNVYYQIWKTRITMECGRTLDLPRQVAVTSPHSLLSASITDWSQFFWIWQPLTVSMLNSNTLWDHSFTPTFLKLKARNISCLDSTGFTFEWHRVFLPQVLTSSFWRFPQMDSKLGEVLWYWDFPSNCSFCQKQWTAPQPACYFTRLTINSTVLMPTCFQGHCEL